MNKKTWILLLVLLGVVAAYFLIKKDTDTTIRKDLMDFSLENVEDIDKIRITKKDEEGSIIVENVKGDYWQLNGTYDANMDMVELVLRTLKNMEVKSPVAVAAKPNVMKYMAVSGKKVEVFSNGKLLKSIYFGQTTPDNLGTYAMLEGAESPYILHIPGFQGYINSRFSNISKEWRSKMIYTIESEEIQMAKVEWTQEPDKSFSIINEEEDPVLKNGKGETPDRSTVNMNKVRSYLNHFEMIPFTSFAMDVNQEKADSISKTKPYCVVTLEDKRGAQKSVRIYYKPLAKNTYYKFDDDGNPLEHEVDKYYAFIDDSTEILVIQDATFQKLMKHYSEFLLQ